ncbi:hypothetical protein [Nocardioides dongkuii]|uniref:hypothetical protein n=1 Tax=Nocardioides dongkuii TaxID=2760089 RepID=UPI001878940A|nr:hypothetical protein [Nocardioides dongkuii]
MSSLASVSTTVGMPGPLVTTTRCRQALPDRRGPRHRREMTTSQRPPVTAGFLERKRSIGTAMTLLLLLGIGVALGGTIGMVLSSAVTWLLAAFAGS